MIKIDKKPFLCKVLDQIICLGFNEVIICTGYKSKEIRSFFNNSYKRLDVRYSQEYKPLGTGGAIRNAITNYKISNMLVFNGDSYCQINYQNFLLFLSKNIPFVTLVKSIEKGRFGSVYIDKKNQIVKFIEKAEETNTKWINAGIYFFPTKYIESFLDSEIMSLEFDVIPNLIKEGLYSWPYGENLLDIGTEKSLKDIKLV